VSSGIFFPEATAKHIPRQMRPTGYPPVEAGQNFSAVAGFCIFPYRKNLWACVSAFPRRTGIVRLECNKEFAV